MKHLYQAKYALFITFFLIHILLGWPGILCPDSAGQYQQALMGIYSDHHPPMMSFVWRYLDKVYAGSGMMS